MSETNERRPLPAGWGWYSVNGFDHIARSRDRARRGYYLAHVLAETWNVFASEADDAAEIAGDTAASPEAARAAAEAECWARGLFGADAVPAAQPPPTRRGGGARCGSRTVASLLGASTKSRGAGRGASWSRC